MAARGAAVVRCSTAYCSFCAQAQRGRNLPERYPPYQTCHRRSERAALEDGALCSGHILPARQPDGLAAGHRSQGGNHVKVIGLRMFMADPTLRERETFGLQSGKTI